jgi:hypothetical protein
MSGLDHLRALRWHGVRADAVVYDPDAEVHFSAAQLARAHIEAIPRPLRAARPDVHDGHLLGAALGDLFATAVPATARRRAAI